MAANAEVVVAGGLGGEYLVKTLRELHTVQSLELDSDQDTALDNDASYIPGTTFEGLVTNDPNGITNHVSLVSSEHASAAHAVFSSNDQSVRILDISRNMITNNFSFGWPINCSDYNLSNCNLRVFVGDSCDGIVMDTSSQQVVCKLTGHSDHGFACAWSPTQPLVATGNQDGTCRIYDLRNSAQSLHVLGTKLNNAVRSMQFDSSGKYLVYAEEMDHVSIFDVHSDFQMGQVLNMWGEISGFGITDGPDGFGQTITVGNFDRTVGGIFQFERQVSSAIDCGFIF